VKRLIDMPDSRYAVPLKIVGCFMLEFVLDVLELTD
jgi:hypothetical protein